jgi:GNAT superfamily N-acetyltransferase
MKRLDEEVRLLAKIYNEAWADNWGFLPLTDEETQALANSLRPVVVPELVRFAYVKGEPAAVVGGIPDLYVPLRPRWRWPLDTDLVRMARVLVQRRRIRRLRGMFLGVRPAFRQMGIDAVLFHEILTAAVRLGFNWVETSMMLENNDAVLRLVEAVGLRLYKTWRIYDLDL